MNNLLKFMTIYIIAMSFIPTTKAQQPNIITTVAGDGTFFYGGDGGPATAAKLYNPIGATVDNCGNIYIADTYNSRIRKVNTSGIITTIAGNGALGFSGDGGAATTAKLNYPYFMAADNSGNIYIADFGNSRIRKVNSSGIISTVAGGGTGGLGDGGAATAATLNTPTSLAIDNLGNIYIADYANYRIRKISSSGIISTIAGNGWGSFSGDGGPATAATLNKPRGVAVDNIGNIYIAEDYNHRIRKIDTFGIINTIAGTATVGISGDGGPAISAELGYPLGIATDNLGNIYIADSRIRKINTMGIINTIAGGGTSGIGDGGLATNASIGPNSVAVDQIGNIYIDDQSNNRIRKVSYPSYIADSFWVFVSNSCENGGIQFTVISKNYSSGQHIKTYFGNGKSFDTITTLYGVNGKANLFETYTLSGTYTIKHVLYNGATAIDSITYSNVYKTCQSFLSMFYIDTLGTCKKDRFSLAPTLLEVDSNSIPIDTVSATVGLYYTAYGGSGDIYTFKIISPPVASVISCPSYGVISDTLVTGNTNINNFSFICDTIVKDLGLHYYVPKHSQDEQWGWIFANNRGCLPIDATITVNFTAKLPSVGSLRPAPISVSGNTVTWGLSGLNDEIGVVDLFFKLNGPTLTIGDTVQANGLITPLTGDIDTTNNYMVIVDTVKAGFDPNEMQVIPSGCIPSGLGTNQLKYSIGFVNTGNDTAHNIYILDTLSDFVNPHTLRIEFATAVMNITQINTGGHNVVKFEFPNINLLDSSHHTKSSGAVYFNINTNSGLPQGTNIINRAGIYFDINPVVMTNTVGNLIGCPSKVSIINTSSISIHPNPAMNELIINSDLGADQSFTITNVMGQQLIEGTISTSQTKVNLGSLPSGLYYITFKTDAGSIVKKFVKM